MEVRRMLTSHSGDYRRQLPGCQRREPETSKLLAGYNVLRCGIVNLPRETARLANVRRKQKTPRTCWLRDMCLHLDFATYPDNMTLVAVT